MKLINPDNVFGSKGSSDTFVYDGGPRLPFVNHPTKGKTRRKKMAPPMGKKTNVGDPMKGQSIGRKGKS